MLFLQIYVGLFYLAEHLKGVHIPLIPVVIDELSYYIFTFCTYEGSV
jgi:hypothetical protein